MLNDYMRIYYTVVDQYVKNKLNVVDMRPCLFQVPIFQRGIQGGLYWNFVKFSSHTL